MTMRMKASERFEQLIGRLAPVVREEMLKVARPDCCIATVAVLRRVFQCFGFEARPLASSLTVYNAAMIRLMRSGARVPTDPKERARWMDLTGAWSVGIVPETAEQAFARGYPAFGGHLVCQVRGLIVDAALDQVNRPHKKIELPSFATFDATPAFLSGEKELYGEVNGCELVYRVIRDVSWQRAPDWTDPVRYRGAVNAILERVEL